MKKEISGAMTAMVTPFAKDGIDVEGLRRNVDFQIESGISGLVPLGTTGESPTISDEERDVVIRAVVEQAAGRVPVYVGTGTNSTEKTIRHSRRAQELGADGVLVVSPYYNKPTQEGLYLHFTAVAEAIDIPIIVYNIAGRTGVNIETPTLKRMAAHKGIAAVKEASGNLNQMIDVIEMVPEIDVLSGDDSLTLPLMAVGGKGVISVVSNVAPRQVSNLCTSALSGDFDAARKIHYDLLHLYRAAFVETNPAPIKTAMHFMGMPSGPLRLPMCPLSRQSEERLKAVLKKMELLK